MNKSNFNRFNINHVVISVHCVTKVCIMLTISNYNTLNINLAGDFILIFVVNNKKKSKFLLFTVIILFLLLSPKPVQSHVMSTEPDIFHHEMYLEKYYGLKRCNE